MEWGQEEIPDGDALFMRVHHHHVIDGELQPGVFRDQGGAMSSNWNKYCTTAEEARQKARVPADNGVVRGVVGPIRKIPLEVQHTPDLAHQDRSHTDIRGNKTSEVRMKLLDVFEWAIRLQR